MGLPSRPELDDYSHDETLARFVLTDKAGKLIDANATLETTGGKFAETANLSFESDGTHRIVCIPLGRTSYSVVFE